MAPFRVRLSGPSRRLNSAVDASGVSAAVCDGSGMRVRRGTVAVAVEPGAMPVGARDSRSTESIGRPSSAGVSGRARPRAQPPGPQSIQRAGGIEPICSS